VTSDTQFRRVAGGERPIEALLAVETVKRAIVVGPPLVLLFAVLRGADGAIASALGVVTVVGYFLFTGWLLSVAARISLAVYQGAALFGFFVRLGLITVTLLGLANVFEIDRRALGLSVVVAYAILLAWESVAVARDRERELDWNR
jgi:hypothetical protein